ncbi:MAG: sugar phosphate isomerase/epimerase family protein [Gemmatimonadales bacterium]
MHRFAICNETFGDWPWERVCRFVAEVGYDGIEIAPFTFAESVEQISPGRRREIQQVADDAGLPIVALHWLLASPKGLHIHTRDDAVRRRTVEYLRALVHFAGDLGAERMIFGSPAQRRLEGGDRAGAWERTAASYRQVMPDLEARGVILCQEALPAPEADFIMTAAEAAQLVREIDHPNFRMMLDVKSMCSEQAPPAETVRRYAALSRHFHANDANRRGPGFGDTDFKPIAAALKETGYADWVSVEVFDYSPDPETIARESLRYLREAWV